MSNSPPFLLKRFVPFALVLSAAIIYWLLCWMPRALRSSRSHPIHSSLPRPPAETAPPTSSPNITNVGNLMSSMRVTNPAERIRLLLNAASILSQHEEGGFRHRKSSGLCDCYYAFPMKRVKTLWRPCRSAYGRIQHWLSQEYIAFPHPDLELEGSSRSEEVQLEAILLRVILCWIVHLYGTYVEQQDTT